MQSSDDLINDSFDGLTCWDQPAQPVENKDPISKLQEIAILMNYSPPEYCFNENLAAPLATRFEARVNFGPYSASGSGATKKEAKRAAATAVLFLAKRGALNDSTSRLNTEMSIFDYLVNQFDIAQYNVMRLAVLAHRCGDTYYANLNEAASNSQHVLNTFAKLLLKYKFDPSGAKKVIHRLTDLVTKHSDDHTIQEINRYCKMYPCERPRVRSPASPPVEDVAFYWCILVMESYSGYAMLNAPVAGINHVLGQLITDQRFDLDSIEGHPYTDASYLLDNLRNVECTDGPHGIREVTFRYNLPELHGVHAYINPPPEKYGGW
jgi:hypothetical protein